MLDIDKNLKIFQFRELVWVKIRIDWFWGDTRPSPWLNVPEAPPPIPDVRAWMVCVRMDNGRKVSIVG